MPSCYQARPPSLFKPQCSRTTELGDTNGQITMLKKTVQFISSWFLGGVPASTALKGLEISRAHELVTGSAEGGQQDLNMLR